MPAPPAYWDDAELERLAADAASAYQAWRASQAKAEQQTFATEQADFQRRLSEVLAATNDLKNLTAKAFTAPGCDILGRTPVDVVDAQHGLSMLLVVCGEQQRAALRGAVESYEGPSTRDIDRRRQRLEQRA